MSKVFISGSIVIKEIPKIVEESLNKIIESDMEILVGDANGIDTMVQNYCKQSNYYNVTVYSIYSSPRYKVSGFNSKYIIPLSDSKKERELQKEKDAAMTLESDYSLVIWDGKSKGSYNNILRAIESNKKVKLYLSYKKIFIEPKKITANEIEYLFRENNGYSAAEVVEYLNNEGMNFFQQTRELNKYLIEYKIIKKEGGIYLPMPGYNDLFIVDKYRGKTNGIRFTNKFINWVENRIKKIKLPEEQSLF